MVVKLLDFWAPWCVDPETPILTESGYISASLVKIGQKVATIDSKTHRTSYKPVQKIKTYKDVPSKKVVLETGRSLIGDLNHLVLMLNGFKKLNDLKTGDKILVDPANYSETYTSDDNSIILTTTGSKFADTVLSKLNLLPLKASDPRLPILARLLGFVVTDGYLYEDLKHHIKETHFFVGTEQDAENIKQDLLALGFDKLQIKRQISNRVISGRKFTISCLRCRSFSHALFYLLSALGSPIGRKKNQACFVPDWVINGNLSLKREFLGGWIGGDGCKIDYYTRYEGLSSHYSGFKVNAIEFHKEKDLEREGLLYAEQLRQLLNELGVGVREVRSVDDEDGVIISIHLSTDYESLLNLAKIGYSYAHTKNSQVPFIREFLQYRLFERSRYTELKQVVLQQLALGLGSQSIAQDLQIPVGTVTTWRYNKTAQVTHPSNGGQAKFNEWVKEREQSELLWEKVNSIEDVENRDVIGITIGNPRTIITNGIVSHNCGPCKMMEPIFEELKKEYDGKVEFEEINVDEHSDISSARGVMSIPTYILEKDGKEVARKVGYTSKAEMVKLLTNIS